VPTHLLSAASESALDVNEEFERLGAVVFVELGDLVDGDHSLPIIVEILPAPS
jgi:hypothetical protein